MKHYRKPLSVVSILGGLALIMAGLVAPPAGAAEAGGPVTYMCQPLLNGTIPLGQPVANPVTVTMSAPASVKPGQSFDVSIEVVPGFTNGPVAIKPSDEARATMTLKVTGGTPGSPKATSNTNVVGPANGNLVLPELGATVKAGNSGAVSIAAGQMQVKLKSGFLVDCTKSAGSASIKVSIDADATTTTVDPDATTTTIKAPPTTKPPTTKPPGTTAVPATTAAPTPNGPAPAGPGSAEPVTKSATVSYSCQAHLSGAATGPPVVDDLEVTITGVDRVNPGQSFPVSVSVSPGVKNGPVPLGAGEVVPSIELSVSGGSPSPLRMTGAPNASDVAAEGLIPISSMSSSVTATAGVGGTVDLKPGVISMTIERFDAAVTCTPSSRPTVLSVAVVDEPLVVAGVTQTSGTGSTATGTESLANTGGSMTGPLTLFGLGLVLAGFAALRMGREKARAER